ncbi:MAG: UDP-N-acetylglucosamine--N-acetylmuramyl-(pentapeptide) pyrophosphoryl-undecaprenol N-acetylglucosamine transferase [Patescibacteria group bacterium]|nr:UDP-N-acetylglucosamine--N-acetylmuramyl-(pentapeptide) pyrophosphoryl-undecaprenol N-acetylglucosamine transferase [Patescibacteria group bacterium]MDE2588629.1 UDP-N-acetylglucosamine--N-acetylmuramyl-(pentapeptide) pyrophosphoryl-undecaprenol N-acetylglucosamine transferase [Patescibacteria group bacterium]
MKIAILGGHVTPALKVLEHFPKGMDAVYIGRKFALEGDSAYSLEYQALHARGIPFFNLTTGRLQRTFTLHTIPSLIKLPQGFWQSFRLLREIKPDVILGFGGYLSVPVGIVGKLMGIPLIIHEQTLEAGLANRMLTPFADKICISWDTSRKFFPANKTTLTGNPAVTSIFEKTHPHRLKKGVLPHLVIVGGSLGSHAMNTLIEGCLEELLKHYEVLHQTGDAREFRDFDRLAQKRDSLGPILRDRYTLIKFIDPNDIVSVFESADLVVTRAGINTVTTLLLLNKPALLIPLPTSQKNEQLKNAQFLKQHKLGEIFNQTTGTPEKLFTVIETMVKQKNSYTNTGSQEELTIHKHSIQKIIDTIIYVTKKTSE